jgi:hypothetical protein
LLWEIDLNPICGGDVKLEWIEPFIGQPKTEETRQQLVDAILRHLRQLAPMDDEADGLRVQFIVQIVNEIIGTMQ